MLKDILTSTSNVQIVCTLQDLKEVIKTVVNEVQPQPQDQEQYMLPDEVCSLLSISKPTLWRYAKSGYLVPVKVGKFNRYRKSSVNKILEGMQ